MAKVRIETRGAKHGRCNICGQMGPLTEDHTPPKGCVKPRQVEVQSLLRKLTLAKAGPGSRFSQNGLKYRTLCARCNNSLLGGTYDPALIEFAASIKGVAETRLALPNVLRVAGVPGRICRSVVGHLSAQGVDRYLKGAETELIAAYILSEAEPLPASISIGCWLYPYQSTVVVRDAAYLDLGSNNPFAIWLLKFYPVAFYVAWNADWFGGDSVTRLDRLCVSTPEARVEIPITIRPTMPQHWPEAPSESSVLAFGREAVTVEQRTPRARR
jgi:hypothetical protein